MPKINKELSLSAEEMRRLGYAVIDQIVAHYEQVGEKPVTRMGSRPAMEGLFNEPIPQHGTGVDELLKR